LINPSDNLKKTKKNKVGMFGGTFDPPHNAHLELARCALVSLSLRCIYFIPAARHALKKNTMTPVDLRFAMLQAALAGRNEFKISRIEMDRSSVSYTVDTLRNFIAYESLPVETELYYLLGMDNLNELHLWKDPQEIFRLARVVIFNRPGYRDQRIIDRYPQVLLPDSPVFKVSATAIRTKIKAGEKVTDLIPAKVWEIICENNLYRD
jgi:nicotinate-nucleotide adenylyltransferase